MKTKNYLLLLFFIPLFHSNHCLAQTWLPFAENVSSNVRAIYHDEEEDLLYIGGAFVTVGNDTVNCIATWDGQEWNKLGDGSTRPCDICTCPVVHVITKFQGDIYATGRFLDAPDASHILFSKWNSISWDSISTIGDIGFLGLLPTDSLLYAFGPFENIAGVAASMIVTWNGEEWKALDDTVWQGWTILDAAIYKGDLYVGGNFWSEGFTMRSIARWDGYQWHNLNAPFNGFNATVTSLQVFDDHLYVGGVFNKLDGNPGDGIARWDGENWEEVGVGIGGYPFPLSTVKDMDIFNDKLWVAGQFLTAGDINATGIASWDGNQWCGYENGLNNAINILEFYQDTAYVALSGFAQDTIQFLAKYSQAPYSDGDCSIVSNTNEAEREEIQIYPNPASDQVTIQIPNHQLLQLSIFAVDGTLLQEISLSQNRKTIPLKNLPNGLLIFTLKNESGQLIQTKRIFKLSD